MSMSIRTIFLFIRGIDQSGRALKAVQSNVEKLKDRQDALAQASYRLLFAGAAFTAFGAMVAKSLAGIVGTTDRGAGLMDDFNTIITRLKENIGDAILDKFGEQLEGWLGWLEELADDPWMIDLIATFAVEGTGALITAGLALMAGGGLAGALGALAGLAEMAGMAGLATTLATLGLYAATGAVIIAAAVILKFALSVVWDMLPDETTDALDELFEPVQGIIDAVRNPAQGGINFKNWLDRRAGTAPNYSGYGGHSGSGQANEGPSFSERLASAMKMFNITNIFENVNTRMDEEELLEGEWYADAYRDQIGE